MKTAIVYYSHHHGNTKKLLDAIALQNEVTLIDATSTNKVDLSEYDRIVLHRAFIIETLPSRSLKGIRQVVNEKNSIELGEYHCQGFDTFGPFKLVGGKLFFN